MHIQAVHAAAALVVDNAGYDRNAHLIDTLGLRAIRVDQLVAEQLDDSDVVVIDVDVTEVATVRRLRKALAHRHGDCLKLFAIDTSRRIEVVYANIIGATDSVRRPFVAAELSRRIEAHRQRAGAIDGGAATGSIRVAAQSIGDMFEALMAARSFDVSSVLEAGGQVVDAITEVGFPSWVDIVRSHHQGTFQHCLIVTGLATSFGRSTGMSHRDMTTLSTTALLHDIGKAAVPVAILDKDGTLSPAEVAVIRQHPARGYDYLKHHTDVDSAVLEAVRGHHEYLDGTGYPDGLMGDEIGDLTRILTICDVYGALVERRAYRPPMHGAAALAILDEMAEQGKVERALVRAFHATV